MSYNPPNDKAARGIVKHTFEQILAAIIENNGIVIDDHRKDCDSYAEMVRSVYAIGKHGDDTVLLCSAEETPQFGLNRMYVDDDGIPHLSHWTVGGTIDLREHGSLEKAVEAYNDPKNWSPGTKLIPVTDVVYFEKKAKYVYTKPDQLGYYSQRHNKGA